MICECENEIKEFCSRCLVFHISEKTFVFHKVQGLFEFGDISDEFLEVQERVKKIGFLKESVKKNIQDLADFENSLENEKNLIKSGVENYFDEIENQILDFEAYLSRILQDLNSCKKDNDATEASVMQKYNLQIVKAKPIKLLDFEIYLDPTLSSLESLASISLKKDLLKSDLKVYFFKPRNKELIIIEIVGAYIFRKIFPKNFLIRDSGS